MAGAKITLEVEGLEPVLAVLKRLRAAVQHMQPVFADIGEYLLQSHDERWDRQEDPEGNPWEELSEKHLARKRDKGKPEKILVLDQHLKNLDYNDSDAGLEFGTPWIYGATHQFGAVKGAFGSDRHGRPIPWNDIPPRPFLGLSAADEAEVLTLVSEWLEQVVERASA